MRLHIQASQRTECGERTPNVIKEKLQHDEANARALAGSSMESEGKGCKVSNSDLSCLSWNAMQRMLEPRLGTQMESRRSQSSGS